MSAYGKPVYYHDLSSFAANLDEVEFSILDNVSLVEDPMRYYSGTFWTKEKGLVASAKNKNKLKAFDIEYDSTRDDVIILKADKNKFITQQINKNGFLVNTFSPESWKNFVDTMLPSDDTDVKFVDHYTEFPEPLNIKEFKQAPEPSISYINREFVNNYSAERYELVTNDKNVSETSLPSIFAFLNPYSLEAPSANDNLVMTFGGKIQQQYAESLKIYKKYNPILLEYFNLYAENYNSTDSSVIITALDFNKNIDLDNSYFDRLNKIEYVPFPWYMSLKFTNLSSQNDNFIHILDKYTDLKQNFINYIKNSVISSASPNFVYNSQNTIEEKNLKVFDLKEWLSTYLTNLSNIQEFGAINYDYVNLTSLMKYIKDNIKPKVRKYKDLMTKTCEKHVLMYKIEKRLFGYNRGSPIQTFWLIPNKDNVINFIDTQIKYGSDYYYTVYAYTLICGSEYSYRKYKYEKASDQELYDIQSGVYKFYVDTSSSYKILEIPMGNFSGAIHEQPYTSPQLTFTKQDNNIRINLLDSKDVSLEKIHIIENNEFKLYESIRKSQENNDEEKIYFKNLDDEIATLQIYRTNTFPVNYLSFQGKLYKTIDVKKNSSFLESIVPNIKYYYTFRFLNKHNTPSNPSPVYELQMKNEDGYYYLNVKSIDLDMTQKKVPFKNLKRYLLIRPSILQTQINLPNYINSMEDVTLGPTGETVWKKDFMVRITSKKTNRIIELNINSTIERQKK